MANRPVPYAPITDPATTNVAAPSPAPINSPTPTSTTAPSSSPISPAARDLKVMHEKQVAKCEELEEQCREEERQHWARSPVGVVAAGGGKEQDQDQVKE